MNEQLKQEPKAMACPKCAGNMIERGFIDANKVVFSPAPGKLQWTQARTSPARAMVCDQCGYAEVYATQPGKLRES